MTGYKKELVVLETDRGTAKNRKHLIKVWKERIRKYFPHYKLKSVRIQR